MRGGEGRATWRGPGAPSFVGVVIPANDEAGVVAQSIDAVLRASAHPCLERSAFFLVVVDDSSSDMTAERAAARMGSVGQVIRVEAHSVGAARRAGFVELCRASEGLDADDVWLATTDADTLVRRDWLARQLRWWRRGAEAVAGTVTPISWHEQPAIVRRRYEALMARLGCGLGHPHVHGANLGLTKAAYVTAGGVSGIESGEDHGLWDAVRASGRAAVHVPDVVVATSTRREGRAPAGFSALLRSLEERG
jgi:hypothetical protein